MELNGNERGKKRRSGNRNEEMKGGNERMRERGRGKKEDGRLPQIKPL